MNLIVVFRLLGFHQQLYGVYDIWWDLPADPMSQQYIKSNEAVVSWRWKDTQITRNHSAITQLDVVCKRSPQLYAADDDG